MNQEVAAALRRDQLIDITTTGRRRGRPVRIEIWFLEIDGRYFITGTPGRRDWMANLAADPRLVFHLKESTIADLEATASPVSDEETRQMVFRHPKAAWYRSQASVEDLVRDAPLVEVTLAEA